MRSMICAAATLALGLAAQALAAQALAAPIEVQGAWIRTPPRGAPTAAGYATITNRGRLTDRLMGARSAAAASVTPHQMSTTGGIMRMRPIVGGLPIGPSATVRLAPGGDHLMLVGLRRPLKAGEHVRIVLDFQRAGRVPTEFTVRDTAPAGGRGAMGM